MQKMVVQRLAIRDEFYTAINNGASPQDALEGALDRASEDAESDKESATGRFGYLKAVTEEGARQVRG